MAQKKQINLRDADLTKELPHSDDLERTIVGTIILEGSCIEKAVSLGLDIKHFYNPKFGEVFEAASEIYGDGNTPDMILIVQRLMAKNSDITPYEVSILSSAVSGSSNFETHCLVLIQKYAKRQQILAGYEIVSSGFDGLEDPFDSISAGVGKLEAIINESSSGNKSMALCSVRNEVEEDLERRKVLFATGECTGITTGLKDLDEINGGGWQNNNLIILAARPGMGKTALMLKYAISAAKAGYWVYIVSLEMTKAELYKRMILSECDVEAYKLRTGNISMQEQEQINKAMDIIDSLPISIDDDSCMTIEQIRCNAKMLHKKGQCDMVMADYLGFITTTDRAERKDLEVGIITKKAKNLAKELNIPFIMLCQLNRSVENRPDKVPTMADLRESGNIEQDADVIAMLMRPKYYKMQPESEDGRALPENTGYTFIRKNRAGRTGIIYWHFNDSMSQISDLDTPDTASFPPPPPGMDPMQCKNNFQNSQEPLPF